MLNTARFALVKFINDYLAVVPMLYAHCLSEISANLKFTTFSTDESFPITAVENTGVPQAAGFKPSPIMVKGEKQLDFDFSQYCCFLLICNIIQIGLFMFILRAGRNCLAWEDSNCEMWKCHILLGWRSHHT